MFSELQNYVHYRNDGVRLRTILYHAKKIARKGGKAQISVMEYSRKRGETQNKY